VKIAFIGGGNMASALIGGLIARGTRRSAICVIEPRAAARRRLAARFKVHTSAALDARALAADTVVLAVKPQDMRAAAAPLIGKLDARLVISVAAGIRLRDLARWLGGHAKLIRCMPNTPALIGAGIAGLYAPPGIKAAQRRSAERILGAVGKFVWVQDESLLDPVTAVSASGPAYVFWFIEQLARAGEDLGLAAEVSRKLALQTVLGAAQLAAGSQEPPAVLRERVTSKGGTTAAALKVFEEEGLAERFRRAVAAASRRGSEIGDELGRG
jgi:pyrroline-5-carboxylate reductase